MKRTRDIPNAIVVLEKAASDDEVVIEGVDESLTYAGVALEGTDAELLRRDGQGESRAGGRSEEERNDSR